MDWRGKGRAHARQILLALGAREGERLEEPPRFCTPLREALGLANEDLDAHPPE